jgi:3-dehydroquinate dehydratase type I
MKKKFKIVIPIFLNSDFKKIERKIKKAKILGADFVELRADSFFQIKKEDLRKLRKILKKLKIPGIFTLRSKEEGGKFNFEKEKKLELIKEAINLGFEFVDVEMSFLEKIGKDVLSLKKKSKVKIILSYHNFKKPLTFREIEKIKRKMEKLKPDIYKIAVISKGKFKKEPILKLIEKAKKEKKKIIAIAMGEKAKFLRIKAMKMGNYLNYFSLDPKEKTAPGQVWIGDLDKVFLRGKIKL